MSHALVGTARESALAELAETGWVLSGTPEGISRDFVFKDFSQAFGFMTRVAFLAEKADHHPEWSNVYKRVTIRLSTHSAKGLTQLDIDLARAINKLLVGS